MKKLVFLGMTLFLTVFGLTGCGYDHTTKEGIALDYGINSEHLFVYKTFSDITQMIDNGDKVLLYYGNPDCTHCQTNIKIFDQYSRYYNEENDNKIKEILYLNSLEYDLDTELSTLKSKYAISDYTQVPQLILFNDGAVVKQSYKDYTNKGKTFIEATREIFEAFLALE